MIPSCHILHYKGKTIIYDNGVYKVVELFRHFLSMTEAIKTIDKVTRDEFFVNLKQLNETNKAEIKQG